MSIKKKALATLVAFLTSMILTTVWYMITDEANEVPYRREEMNYAGLMVNHLIYAFLMVLLFPAFYQAKPGSGRVLVFGLIVSALMFIPQAIVVRSIWEVDFNSIFILNTMAHLVIGAIMAWMIYLINRSK